MATTYIYIKSLVRKLFMYCKDFPYRSRYGFHVRFQVPIIDDRWYHSIIGWRFWLGKRITGHPQMRWASNEWEPLRTGKTVKKLGRSMSKAGRQKATRTAPHSKAFAAYTNKLFLNICIPTTVQGMNIPDKSIYKYSLKTAPSLIGLTTRKKSSRVE